MTQQFLIGSVVSSTSGHDKGRLYIIRAIDGDFASLTDGDYRPLLKPKKKRLKHILLVKAEGIDEETLGKMHDYEIKTYLKQCKNV